MLIEVRKFEKVDYKLRKVQFDLDFLYKCKDSDLIPNFLNFPLANKKLQDSLTYNFCQCNLLIPEITLKKSCLRVFKNEFYLIHSELKNILNCIDFAHVGSLFLSNNDMILKSHDSTQQKKFNVFFKNHQPNHNTDGVIFNYSKIYLPDAKKVTIS